MIQEDKAKYSDILENSITYLEKRGFENIKADIDGYETPKSYLKSGSDITITPDIVAEKEGKKHYFDMSLKSEKPNLLKSKWLFLKRLSALKASRFKLITTKGHYAFTQEMLKETKLDKNRLIKI